MDKLLIIGAVGVGAFLLFNNKSQDQGSDDVVLGGGGSGGTAGPTDPLSQILASNPLGDFFKADPAKPSPTLAGFLGGIDGTGQPLNEGGGLPLGTRAAVVDSPATLLQMQVDRANGMLQKDLLQTKTNARGDVTLSLRDDVAQAWAKTTGKSVGQVQNEYISEIIGKAQPGIYGAGRTNLDGSITSFNIPFTSNKTSQSSSGPTYYTPTQISRPSPETLTGKYQNLASSAGVGFSPSSTGGFQSRAPIPSSSTKKEVFQSSLSSKSGGGGFR